MNNLIMCPVGSPLTFDSRFDRDHHWRFTKPNRLYETLIFQYSDFKPEDNTYDLLIKQKGLKWELIKSYLNNHDYKKYEYIGFFDDDLITDIDNINRALKLASENQIKLFQLSVTEDSDIFWPILKNKKNIKYTTTNFNEVMGNFIHTSLIEICLDLWNLYDIKTGWGFDKVVCDLTKQDAAVIHCSQMYHPKREGNYDKSKAFAEMDHLLNVIFPKFMRKKYNEDWFFQERQYEKKIIMEI